MGQQLMLWPELGLEEWLLAEGVQGIEEVGPLEEWGPL